MVFWTVPIGSGIGGKTVPIGSGIGGKTVPIRLGIGGFQNHDGADGFFFFLFDSYLVSENRKPMPALTDYFFPKKLNEDSIRLVGFGALKSKGFARGFFSRKF